MKVIMGQTSKDIIKANSNKYCELRIKVFRKQ